MPAYCFKQAEELWEFEQIHRLNYRTFVEEIPQHTPNSEKRLVDKFHAQNSYTICINDQQLLGMVALRGRRPFSLDEKLADLDSYLPPHSSLCEIRLLAVEPAYRTGRLFFGLLQATTEYGLAQGYDLAVMSGTTRQLKLYRHLGFVPFGPLVGPPEATYQPMYITLDFFMAKVPPLLAMLENQ